MTRLIRARARTLIGVGAVAALVAGGAVVGSVLTAGATPVPITITACVSSFGGALYNVVQSPASPKPCFFHDQRLTWSEAPAAPAAAPQYAYIYDVSPPNIPGTVGAGTDVPLANNGPMSSGVTYASNGQITIAVAGVYHVSFLASVTEPGQLELTQNGTPLPSTVYGRATGTSEISGQAILNVAAGDVITLRNPAGNSPALTFTPIAGGTQPDVSASITIEQVG
jgi:hypothetical protein